MREIKFKAFDKERNKMVYVCELDWFAPIVQGGSTQLWVHNSYSLNEHEAIAGMVGQRYELLQYTGLKDKNGKEIYEGDVVEYLERGMKNCVGIGQVTWNKDGWNVEGFYDGSQDEPGRAFSENAQLEIIGNVWENPELIEK